jgi:hypothetical protein
VTTRTVPNRARLQRLTLFGFPVALIVSDLLLSGLAADDSTGYLANVADNRGRVLVGSILGMVTALLFVAVAQAVSERLAPAAPRWAWYAKLVAWVGMFAGYAINAAGLFDWARTDPSLDPTQMATLGDVLMEPAAFVPLYQPGILAPLGVLALGIGLWRTRAVAPWVARVTVAAAVAFPMGQIPDLLPAQFVCAALFLAVAIGLVRSAAAAGAPIEPAVGAPLTAARAAR